MRKCQPRDAAKARCVSGSSGDDTTKAARFSRCGNTPLNPSAHIVQAGQDLPILWMTNRGSFAPNNSDRRTGPSAGAKREFFTSFGPTPPFHVRHFFRFAGVLRRYV